MTMVDVRFPSPGDATRRRPLPEGARWTELMRIFWCRERSGFGDTAGGKSVMRQRLGLATGAKGDADGAGFWRDDSMRVNVTAIALLVLAAGALAQTGAVL